MLSNKGKTGKAWTFMVQPMVAVFSLRSMSMGDIRIRENSWLAGIAAKKLRVGSVALTIGNTIHLHRASRQEFLKNKRWLRHELAHVQQFRKYGFLSFICMYVAETVKNGYVNNKYEVEARKAETDL